MVCVIRCLKWRHCTQLRLIFDFLYPIALFPQIFETLKIPVSGIRKLNWPNMRRNMVKNRHWGQKSENQPRLGTKSPF